MSQSNPPTKNVSKKKLAAVIGYLSSLTVACCVMMWGVFNISLNLLAFQANELPEQRWWITACMVLVTCVIPFLIGLKLLSKTLISK